MAGDWIKMRVWLAKDPKVIAIADWLSEHRPFMDWLSDPVRRHCDKSAYEHVTRHVTVSVTVTGLLQLWGVTREDGHRDGDDLIVPMTDPTALDEIAGFPGLGEAMEFVGWAVYDENEHRTIFPKFFTRNASSDEMKRIKDAERQRRRRENLTSMSRDSHADESRDCHADVTHREEKRREEKEKNIPPPPPPPLCVAHARAQSPLPIGKEGSNGGSGGGGKWEEAKEVANRILAQLHLRLPPDGKFRRLTIQVAYLSITTLDETWLDEAIEDTARKKPKAPWAYFRACLATGAEARGHNLDALLAAIVLPKRFAQPKATHEPASC
jgi:hypothetical protein